MNKLYTLSIGIILVFIAACAKNDIAIAPPVQQNTEVLLQGWNTWNNPSVLSHVKMPEGLNIQLMLKKRKGRPCWLDDARISNPNMIFEEKIIPGKHAWDGSFTELELEWEGQRAVIKTATCEDDFYLLYEPLESKDVNSLQNFQTPYFLVVRTGILWNKNGKLTKNGDEIFADFGETSYKISSTESDENLALPLNSPYLSFYCDKKVAIYTGTKKTLEEIEILIARKEKEFDTSIQKYGPLKDAYQSMQSVMAWNLFYEAENQRAIVSVSRTWNQNWGGYIIFGWDTYFAALMAAMDYKELAYSNAISITNAITDEGFVPNLEASNGIKSFDRSQPPVGSMICKLIYEKYSEKWFLEEVYQNLLTWNRWWEKERNNNGFLSWGSNPHPKGMNGHSIQGAKWESGLDNSPLFDDVVFNPED
ncbi:MAG: MGH1-like glycoside hydrolase domain-containing protein, partial [Bacteroidales bacterium]